MAEGKEERITIVRLFKGEWCPLYDKWHDECAEFADRLGTSHCEKCSVGMTRQETIRIMCDAYFKAKDKGATESERVEAALNALLEGNNGSH